MGLRKNKKKTLFWLFLRQVLWISILIFMEIMIFLVGFNVGLNRGIILPANYSEYYLQQNKEKIAQSMPFDPNLILHTCRYGLFDKEGSYVTGNLTDEEIEDAEGALQNGENVNHLFYLIERENDNCLVSYDVTAHFASPFLHKLFPKLEWILIIVFVVIFGVIITCNAFLFGRRLKKQLNPLMEEIAQIRAQELNPETKQSSIKEFSDVLTGLSDMKEALSQSLEKEWKTEQKRKDNISALAHDIKTPLTIIKGNAELIEEEENLNDIYEYAQQINDNSEKIERYIRLLIEEAKDKAEESIVESISAKNLADSLIQECVSLCKANHVEVSVKKESLEDNLRINQELVQRAIMNIVMNAIEHTKAERKIRFSCTMSEGQFIVSTEDYGTGFSKEALRYGKEQFYTEKKERQGEHYGLGLYFAESVAQKYHGSLSYYNKENRDGAVVVFKIESVQKKNL